MNHAEINTSYPGFIYNFNAADQTADVQLAIETLTIGLDSNYTAATKQRLQKVPVQFMRGGGWSLTFPIPDGTPCYIEFAQRGIDHWLFEGKDAAGIVNNIPDKAFHQKFSSNNAVAHIGIDPITAAIGNFATDGVELRNAAHDQILSLKSDGTINLITGSTTLTLAASGDITMHTDSAMNVTADGSTTIKSPTITLDGDVSVTKTLTVTGASSLNGGVSAKGGSGASMAIEGTMTITSTINGIQIESHGHPYTWTDGSGNSVTSPPNPA